MPKSWFPIESNPEVMNNYAGRLGLDTSIFSFQDVLSTESWALEMIPQPVVGVLMLYPIKESSEQENTRELARILNEGQYIDQSVYFMKQTVGNACGTIGILHSIANARPAVKIQPNSYLDKFFAATAAMTPEEIAAYLESDDEIEHVHETAAADGQSAQDADVDSHFVCFR